MNESLKKSEERLMVEEVQDYAILYLNHEGTVENWNLGAEKIKDTKPKKLSEKFRIFIPNQIRKKTIYSQNS
jgi:hypothetical protein